MKPLLTIVGATGMQGSSVLASALKENKYRIRAITRNVNSEKASALSSQGIEVVSADLNDEASLLKAFESSTAIFAMTNFFEKHPDQDLKTSMAIEISQGKKLANAAAKTPTLEHYIWSTLPSSAALSGGKYMIANFQTKAEVNEYIKSKEELYRKTTFMIVTFYATNLLYPFIRPSFLKSANKYILPLPCSPSTPVHLIGDLTRNLGVFTNAILAQPSLTLSKNVHAAVEVMTMSEILKTWSEVTGKEALFVQMKEIEEYETMFPGWGRLEGESFAFWDETREGSWGNLEGIVTMEGLGLKLDDMVSVKQTFEGMDWEEK